MEVDASHCNRTEIKRAHKSFAEQAAGSMNCSYSAHKRSNSDFDERHRHDEFLSFHVKSDDHKKNKLQCEFRKDQNEIKKKIAVPGKETRSCLRQEIKELEKHLQDQLAVRGVLEKALELNKPDEVLSVSKDSSMMMPQLTKELIREIAIMELEVKHMEQYLLTLYREALDHKLSTLPSTTTGTSKQKSSSRSSHPRKHPNKNSNLESRDPMIHSDRFHLPSRWTDHQLSDISPDICPNKLDDPGSHRSRSALSYRAVCSAFRSQWEDDISGTLDFFQSQPLSFLQEGDGTESGFISLAEYLGTNIADHVPDTPNKLSEEMVRSMAEIYCRLADPPLVRRCASSSPASSFSSSSGAFSQNLGETSPCRPKESTRDTRLINPFCVDGVKEFSGPYNTMVEVPSICRDCRKHKAVERLVHNYRLVARRLETVDVRKMKNHQKIAFWVNVHNALVMSAYLEYGQAQSNLKKAYLLNKARCKIGGQLVSAAMIKEMILGCQNHSSGPVLRALLYTKTMVGRRGNGELHGFAIEKPEPLLHFALCSGSHSDPAVRVYTEKRIMQQLEAAKAEFIRATVGVWKEQKILVPKLVESYAKDVKLTSQGLFDMIQRCLPEALKMAMRRCQAGSSSSSRTKIIESVPYNSSFRYLLSGDLAYHHLLG